MAIRTNECSIPFRIRICTTQRLDETMNTKFNQGRLFHVFHESLLLLSPVMICVQCKLIELPAIFHHIRLPGRNPALLRSNQDEQALLYMESAARTMTCPEGYRISPTGAGNSWPARALCEACGCHRSFHKRKVVAVLRRQDMMIAVRTTLQKAKDYIYEFKYGCMGFVAGDGEVVFYCAGCGCHRSFHRRNDRGEGAGSSTV